ncbi:uncharacterized protein LOC130730423 [Lotus japonicus]|uniref:uncharacterized protein LOC130730423 n=1 Tax=Lotus japonicus TaxID=34305 RepID=UPI00258B4C5E|nr:uncharacterized protein LOC130730423 [Lotus japonicus]
MRILAWNCRGLGNPGAVQAVKLLISSEVPDVVFLSETRKSVTKMFSMRRSLGLPNLFPIGCAGNGRSRSGGVCLLWNDDTNVKITHGSLNHILCMAKHFQSRSQMHILAIYGFSEAQHKLRTWELIQRLKPPDTTPWVCVWDFNDVLSPSDKLGGDPVNVAHLQLIDQALQDCGLQDVGYSGYQFTWSNKRSIPNLIEERLDYALMNDSWKALWPVMEVFHLTRLSSDHNPILVSCGSTKREVFRKQKRLFRFEEVRLHDSEECAEIVAEVWSNGFQDVNSKITNVGKSLQLWGRLKFGAIPKKVSDLKVKLQNLQRSTQTDEVVAAIRSTEAELESLLK